MNWEFTQWKNQLMSTLVSENENVPQSSLHFYLQRLLNEPNVAALVISSAFTISFVARENKFIVMDSHCHVQYGALLGLTISDDLKGLLIYLRRLLSPTINLCSLSFDVFG